MAEGYSSATSVRQGERISFHLSGAPGTREFAIEQVSASPRVERFSARIEARSVPPNAWENGYGWPVSHTFTVPTDFPLGLYILTEGGAERASFVVRPRRPGAVSRVLVQLPYTRDQAYNAAGGKSFYGFNSGGETSRASRLSFDRPGGYVGRGGAPANFVRWLEAEGIAVEYCSNLDLHTDPELLEAYQCLVVVFHDEYWSKEMRDRAERFVSNGGNMVVLSGNTCYRAIRISDDGRRMEFHKYAGADPETDNERATVAWAEPPLNRPQNLMHGAGFTEGAYGAGETRAAFRFHFHDHWVFEGIDRVSTEPFMNYEADAAAYVFAPEGYPRVTGEEGTPLNFTVLGEADLSTWTKPGRVTMGLFSRNGTVFNAGTTDWLHAIAQPTIAQITRNVLGRLRTRRPRDWELTGHTRLGRAMAAADGQLFVATFENALWRRYPVRGEVNWKHIGHANDVTAMASIGGTLYCLTGDNRLWTRPPVPFDVDWTPVGLGPEGGAIALAGAGGSLYAVDRSGRLLRRPGAEGGMAVPPGEWVGVPDFTERNARIVAMTSYSDILIAATRDGDLLRSNRDFIAESTGWHRFHHCNHAVGLATVEWMLYVATTDRFWQMDIYGLRAP